MITKKTALLEEYHGGVIKINDSDVDKVFLNFETLHELDFEDNLNEVNRPILKITYKDKSIYRKFKQGAQLGISKNEIGLLRKDLNTLGIRKSDIAEVKITLTNYWGLLCFYWNNPKQDIRFAMRSAVFAFFLSFFLGLLVNYVYDWLDSLFHFFK